MKLIAVLYIHQRNKPLKMEDSPSLSKLIHPYLTFAIVFLCSMIGLMRKSHATEDLAACSAGMISVLSDLADREDDDSQVTAQRQLLV